jgi:nitrate/nitrite transporter NarK
MAKFMGLDPVVANELKEKWVVLFIALVVVITAFSLPAFAPQNMYDMLERDFGWSRTQITALATFKYLTGSVVAVVVGALIDKVGVG